MTAGLIEAKFIVGIDEAGRGPLAGPVAVAAVRLSGRTNGRFNALKQHLPDSKKLSPADRVKWRHWLWRARATGQLDFTVTLVSERIIDRRGIVPAVRLGISRCLSRLKIDPDTEYLKLDGSLKAPARFKHQETIIRGDEQVPIIALASIAAKVARDRKMIRLARRWPAYGFDRHFGYGTQDHIAKIKRLGLCPLHRRSFLSRLK